MASPGPRCADEVERCLACLQRREGAPDSSEGGRARGEAYVDLAKLLRACDAATVARELHPQRARRIWAQMQVRAMR